jgi:hypothetical protein
MMLVDWKRSHLTLETFRASTDLLRITWKALQVSGHGRLVPAGLKAIAIEVSGGQTCHTSKIAQRERGAQVLRRLRGDVGCAWMILLRASVPIQIFSSTLSQGAVNNRQHRLIQRLSEGFEGATKPG